MPRVGRGALERFLRSPGVNTPQMHLANQQPRLGQAFQVAFGFQHRCGRRARVEYLAEVPALVNPNVRLHDRDPGLRGAQASRRGDREALGQGCLCPFQVAERKTHRPEQPEQVGVQPRAGRARREGTLQPAAGLLQQPARQPETAQRPGQLRPGLAAARQRVLQRGAEVVLLGQQHFQLAFGLRQVQERLGMPPPGMLGLARRGQGLRSVLADGLQQPVPGATPGRLGDH